MPLLQVRECPEDIYRKVAATAKKQNRTIAQQVIVLLEKGLGQEQSNKARRRSVLDRIQGRTVPADMRMIDEAVLVREDRER